MPAHPLTASLVGLLARPGTPFARDAALLPPLLDWTLQAGQWVALSDGRQRLTGWAGWFRCDDETLLLLHDHALAACIRTHVPLDLAAGRHCYVHAACVAPWAPAGTIRLLYRGVRAANEDAASLCWHRNDGWRTRWVSTALH